MGSVRRMAMIRVSHCAALLLACCLPAATFAYSVTLSVEVDISRVHERNDSVLLGCSMTHGRGSATTKQFIPLSNGAFSGAVTIALEAVHPLLEYEVLECDVRLCTGQGYEESCAVPITQSHFDSLSGLNAFQRRDKERLVYDELALNQHLIYQELNDSLVMVVPPPSYQLAGSASDKTGKSTSGAQSSGSTTQASQGKAGRISQSMSDGAGSVNTNAGYAETLAAVLVFAVTKNTAALTDVATGSLGVVTNAVFGQVNETSIGIVGDLAGLSISLGGTALAGGAAAGSVAAAGATGLALPLLGAASAGVALGTKLDKALDEPVLRALETVVGYDEEDPEGYREAVAAMERRKAAKKAAGIEPGARPSKDSAARPSAGDSSSSASPSSNNASPQSAAGEAAAMRAETQQSARRAGGDKAPTEKPGEAAVADAADGSGDLYFDFEGEVVDVATGQVDEVVTGGVWLSQEEIDAGSSGSGDKAGGAAGADGTGSSAAGAQGGSGSTDGSDNDAGSESNGESGDDSSSEDSDSDSSDDCSEQGASGCDSESEDGGDEQTDDDTADADTAADSTPNPRDDDNMSEGIAWAMQNPDNPAAQAILAAAAASIEGSSGGCHVGCAESKSKGGLLWAMSNPDNPLAQQILAAAAQSISDNSGSGQTGGVDDNPANEPVGGEASDQDIARIEFLIAGGGLVDPPDDGDGSSGGGSGGENPLTGGGQPITGGSPINVDEVTVHGQTVVNGAEDPNDPDNPEGGLSVDTDQIRAGGLR